MIYNFLQIPWKNSVGDFDSKSLSKILYIKKNPYLSLFGGTLLTTVFLFTDFINRYFGLDFRLRFADENSSADRINPSIFKIWAAFKTWSRSSLGTSTCPWYMYCKRWAKSCGRMSLGKTIREFGPNWAFSWNNLEKNCEHADKINWKFEKKNSEKMHYI